MKPGDMRLLRSVEMQELDRVAQERYGIPGAILMENAGQKAWAHLRRRLADEDRDPGVGGRTGCADRAGQPESAGRPDSAGRPESAGRPDSTGQPRTAPPQRVLFVAGNGNNGGDALVMARQCAVEAEYDPVILTVREELRGAVAEEWAPLERLGFGRIVWERNRDSAIAAIQECRCIVDGITGTGLTDPLRALETALIAELNAATAYRVAIDIPSGMRDNGGTGEPFFQSDLTISTGHRKRLLYAPARRAGAGEITWVDPGFPDVPVTSLEAYSGGDTMLVEPPFPTVPVSRDAHKGTRGRVSIVAGGSGTEGAAILASLGAVSAGAGMVRVWTTPAGCAAGLGREPGVMWREGFPPESEFEWADAIVCGPGWTGGSSADLRTVLAGADRNARPVVLDAAALHLVSDLVDGGYRGEHTPVVMTPHPGELAAMTGCSVDEVLAGPYESLDEAAKRYRPLGRIAILLKGSASILRDDRGGFFVVDGRCPVLGTAGSGDVLSGIIGACLAASRTASAEAVLAGVGEHLGRGRRLEGRNSFVSATTIAVTRSVTGPLPRDASDGETRNR